MPRYLASLPELSSRLVSLRAIGALGCLLIAASCSGAGGGDDARAKEGVESAAAVEVICADIVALPCSPYETAAECLDEAEVLERTAESDGCAREWEAMISCIASNHAMACTDQSVGATDPCEESSEAFWGCGRGGAVSCGGGGALGDDGAPLWCTAYCADEIAARCDSLSDGRFACACTKGPRVGERFESVACEPSAEQLDRYCR